jgi:transposase
VSWGSASSWERTWGKLEVGGGDPSSSSGGGVVSQSSSLSASEGIGIARGIADIANVGIQIGELVSANKAQAKLLRVRKSEAKAARIAARRQSKFRRKDKARANNLQQRLDALKAITGAGTNKAVIAGIGIIALAAIFAFSQRPKPKSEPKRST